MDYFYLYLAVVSIFAVILTIIDKLRAKFHTLRVPEAVLLGWSLIGGSVAMLFTMLLIRHKTKHAKFMVGIPLIILLQIAVAIVIFFKITP